MPASFDMFPDTAMEYLVEHQGDNVNDQETCSECGKPVQTMAFRGTGVCGDDCRKVRAGEVERPKSQIDAGVTNLMPGIRPGDEGLNTRAIR